MNRHSSQQRGDPLAPVGSASLCRVGGLTCGACCWGKDVSRTELTERLRRHRRLFGDTADASAPPSTWRLMWHELRARRGLDLLLAFMLRLPWLGVRLRNRLSDRLVCAFVAFDDDDRQQVGCLIHPSRWSGRDVRAPAAFRLLPGVGCGVADYACAGRRQYDHADPAQKEVLLYQLNAGIAPADWYNFSKAVVSVAHDQECDL